MVNAIILTVPSGAEYDWHTHEAPVFGYILEGELTIDYGSKGVRVYRQGEAVLEAVDWPHRPSNRGTVVTPDSVPKGVVTIHSLVRVRDPRSDESETYTLVYPDEADINEGKLSVLAPLGTALLGARVGKVVQFDAPAGPRRLKVEKILYQPEAAGDFHL